MRVLERLESRRRNWQELEQLCGVLDGEMGKILTAASVSRFANLYRSACADLALADAYQLPPATIQYLHQLVGRAHNQLYRHESLHAGGWYRELFVNVPQRLFADGCLRLAFALFWGVFLLNVFLAWRDPDFAPRIAGKEELQDLERRFSYEMFAPRPTCRRHRPATTFCTMPRLGCVASPSACWPGSAACTKPCSTRRFWVRSSAS